MEYSEQMVLQEDNSMNFRELLTKYLRHWYWFVLGVIILLIGAYLYLHIATPIYQVKGSLLIKQDNGQGGGNLENDILNQLNLFSANANVDNEMAILESHSLTERVVKDLGLCTTYFVQEGLRSKELYRATPVKVNAVQKTDSLQTVMLSISFDEENKSYTVSDGESQQTVLPGQMVKLSSGTFLIQPNTERTDSMAGRTLQVVIQPLPNVVQAYQQDMSVSTSSKTSTVLDLSLKTTVPQKGIDFLSALIQAYNEAGLQDKNQTAANTVRFVDSRLDSISGELSSVESRLEEFLSSNSVADIEEQSKVFLDQVKEVDNELAEQQLRMNVLKSIEQYIKQPDKQVNIVPSSLGIQDPTLLSLIQQYNQLQLQRSSNIQAGARPDNPLIKVLDDQLSRLRADILENVQNLQQGTGIAVNKLEQQSRYFENQIRGVPALQRNYITIKRQQEIKQNLYLYLLQKREEAAISQAAAVYGSRLVDPATSTPHPVSPKHSLIYLVALLLGLAIPGGLLYATDLLNNRIHSRRDVEAQTATPILGEIAHSTDMENIVVRQGARSAIAEQFRSLRTNLGFLTGTERGAKILLVTSSMSGEGKSFISLNLAAGYALADKRTVVLGLDLRNPKLARILQMEHRPGISNYLAGQGRPDELPIELPSGNHQLYFISSGPVPPNPAELLLHPRMDELMQYLRDNFDVILMDLPPIGLVTDAQIMAKYADVSLFIVRHNYTLKGQVQVIEQLYRQQRFPNLAIILNDIKSGEAYRYQYGYGYGYGYYQDEPRPWWRRLGKRS